MGRGERRVERRRGKVVESWREGLRERVTKRLGSKLVPGVVLIFGAGWKIEEERGRGGGKERRRLVELRGRAFEGSKWTQGEEEEYRRRW